MKNEQNLPSRIEISCLPDDIFVAYEPYHTNQVHTDIALLQNQSGRQLIKKMTQTFLGGEGVKVLTQKNEKPQAFWGE